ncbi:MAG: hypothetical protein M1G31_31200, partial [Pseudanabaena sp. Salubria-1]|nr:hypothetical protein [Pseudanabaena sp. Salubria-1]
GFLKKKKIYKIFFGVSSAKGAGNTKIGFFKAHRRCSFKKPIFIMSETYTKEPIVRAIHELPLR